MATNAKKDDTATAALTAKIADLEKRLREEIRDHDEDRATLLRLRDEVAAARALGDWWRKFALQASSFILGLTNTMTLSGRGWQETMRRLEQEKPKVWMGGVSQRPEEEYALAK